MKRSKICTKCGEEKVLFKFPICSANPTGRKAECKVCTKERRRLYYLKNKNKEVENANNWKKNNPERYKSTRELNKEKFPWLSHYYNARQRGTNPNNPKFKNYGGRGIKFKITKNELKELWFRDRAYDMKKPSIDRIDNDGYYEYNNCRFIELSENSQRKRSWLNDQ